MMAATFDLWQQAYILSLTTAGEFNLQGTPDKVAAALNGQLNTFFSQTYTVTCIGQWATVWGPAVFENSPSSTSYADNTMYVAANADRTVYVVAVAGTNPNSTYDEDTEDADVNHTSSWTAAFPDSPPPTGLTPYISVGTQSGVNALLGMVDTLQNTNKNLVTFLQSLPASKTQQATLIFCGHSLAGALTPTLALALFNPANSAGSGLSLSNWGNVYVYPTAGPTPGNADFGTFFSSVFAPIGTGTYQVWNQNVWNSIDVVPHAWNIAMLNEIATLYPASWKTPPLELTGYVDGAKTRSNEGAATMKWSPYEQWANQSLEGTYNSSYRVSDTKSFEAQAGYQHTIAYDVLLNVQDLASIIRNWSNFAAPPPLFFAGRSAGAR
jgi:hypothetical protein